MATVTPTIMKARFSVFSSLSDDQLQSVIDEAYEEMNEDVWGTRLDTGALYLAGHKATVNYLRGTTVGAVQSESVGQVSRTYAVQSSSAQSGATNFEAEFNRIRSGLADARFPLVMGVEE